MMMWINLKTVGIQRTDHARKKEDLVYLAFEVEKVLNRRRGNNRHGK